MMMNNIRFTGIARVFGHFENVEQRVNALKELPGAHLAAFKDADDNSEAIVLTGKDVANFAAIESRKGHLSDADAAQWIADTFEKKDEWVRFDRLEWYMGMMQVTADFTEPQIIDARIKP